MPPWTWLCAIMDMVASVPAMDTEVYCHGHGCLPTMDMVVYPPFCHVHGCVSSMDMVMYPPWIWLCAAMDMVVYLPWCVRALDMVVYVLWIWLCAPTDLVMYSLWIWLSLQNFLHLRYFHTKVFQHLPPSPSPHLAPQNNMPSYFKRWA